MEINQTEKIVIAKPVACRPGISNLKSFSKLLVSAVNASPPAAFSEDAVAVIKPRTLRLKPVCNDDLVGAEVLSSAACRPSKQDPETNVMSTVVYKPVAKVVSKATVSLLANLGGCGIGPTREIPPADAPVQPSNEVKHQTDLTSDFHQAQCEPKANAIRENSEDDNKSLLLPNNADRPSYDGHNWRKYGQKQVKGSEYPRSYYKCTYPSCPVKKKVEKTLDGQIAEIVYKGEHNHPKPQPLNQKPADDAGRNEKKSSSFKGREVGSEDQNNIESSGISTFCGAVAPVNEPFAAAMCNASVSTSNNSMGLSGECEEVSESLEAEGDGFKSKRMKCDNQLLKGRTAGEASSESRTVVEKKTDSEIIGDGYRWRKYGQKVVKGNPYPRSYYRCTNPKCNVRKYVERTSEDRETFITTYEGRHNHGMPIKRTITESAKTSTRNKS